MELIFFVLGVFKFLSINVLAASVASALAYLMLSPVASSNRAIWILAMPVTGTVTSLIQLAFLRSRVVKRMEWIVFNSVAALVFPLSTFLLSFIFAVLLDKLGVNFSTGAAFRTNTAILGGITGACASGIIAAAHWSFLQESREAKVEWVISIVIVASIISAILLYYATFLQLA